MLVQAEGKRIHAGPRRRRRLGKPFFASEKISTYRGSTPLKSHEVLALQPGANCRKSNFNVYISNDLVQACANDARNTQAARLRSGAAGWSIRLRRARPTDLPSPDQSQTCRTGTIFVLDHSGSLRIFPGLQAK
jgi:hypothetical protein